MSVGLKLRYNLFYSTAEAVYDSFATFYGRRDSRLRAADDGNGSLNFYREQDGWVVVDLGSGWDWKVRREAHLFVSRSLWCPGFLIFVYDGNYWGYEFFDRGEVIYHFVQEATENPIGFPGEDCRGNPGVVAEHLPFLRVEDIAPYLVQKRDWVMPKDMDVPARPGDEFRRFDECAVLDFLRMLGIPTEIRDHYVRLKAPLFRSVD
jgi:hypothetical protein